MHQQDRIERFNSDIDGLLKLGALPDTGELASAEYAEMLALAERLSSADFSYQSQVRMPLRRRLLEKAGTSEGWHFPERIPMITLFQKRSVAITLPALILTSLLIVTLAWPGAVAAAAQSAVAFAQRLWIGERTFVEPIDPDTIIIHEDGSLTMPGVAVDESEIAGQFVHDIEIEGRVEFEIRTFDTIAGAQLAVPFSIRQPDYLPEGYTFYDASVWGEGDITYVNFHYHGPGGDLLLSQRPVGGQPAQTVSVGLPDDYLVEVIQVKGHDAIWAEHVLVWEVEGFSYLLSSPELNQMDAVQIAESMQ